MSVAQLKRKRDQGIKTLISALSQHEKKNYTDETVFKVFLDDEKGLGQADWRWLPHPTGEGKPFILLYTHGFQGPESQGGLWYVNNSLTTFNQKDPVSELYFRLYKTKLDDDAELAKKIKRKTDYWANLLILSDPGRAQTVGKVLKYRFGTTVMKMIEMKAKPKFAGQVPIDPFDLWAGCTFKARLHRDGDKKKGYWKYDQSEWEAPSELFPNDDDAKDGVLAQCYNLEEMLNPNNFKSYDELADELIKVLGPTYGSVQTVVGTGKVQVEVRQPVIQSAVNDVSDDVPVESESSPWDEPTASAPVVEEAEDDDIESFFKEAASKVKKQ